MPDSEIRVAIVGAGLAGCALAVGLRRIGARVLLLEKRRQLSTHDGAGILLAGNATRALDLLGCGEALRKLGHPVGELIFADQHDAPLFELNCRRGDWPEFLVARHALVRDMLLRFAAIQPRLAISVEAIQNTIPPILELSDGTRLECDLLVGADGVYSQVREELFGGGEPAAIGGYQGFRFITKCPPSLDAPRQLIGNGATLLLYPLPNGEMYCGAGPVSPQRWPKNATSLEAIRKIFSDFRGIAREVLDTLDDSVRLIPTRYWNVEQTPWVNGRSVIIGDAAHASAPTLAQGGAMAFEDALVLSEELAATPDIELALRAYELRRRPRVEPAQRAALQRMDANRQISSHEHRMRNAASRRFGSHTLERLWGGLIEQLP